MFSYLYFVFVVMLIASVWKLAKVTTWTRVYVTLHGLKFSDNDCNNYHALVLVNANTGEVRSVPENERRIELCGTSFKNGTLPEFDRKLGAPRWQRVDSIGMGRVAMLGAVYKYHSA
jgi:hypothetical protein